MLQASTDYRSKTVLLATPVPLSWTNSATFMLASKHIHRSNPVTAAQCPPDVDLQVTEADVRRLKLKRVKARKAADPDGIPSCVFKTCSTHYLRFY